MLIKKLFFFLINLAIFLFWNRGHFLVWAQGVVINEFSALSSPDWVELYNLGEEIINLDGWELRDETQTNKINLEGIICPNSFRKFDFSNRLNNGGDEIRLIDNSSNEVNRIVYFSDLVPAHLLNQSTGRVSNGANLWQVFLVPTPQDEACFFPTIVPLPSVSPTAVLPSPSPTISPTINPSLLPTPTETPTILPTPTPNPTSPTQNYNKIFLNEVMADPQEGPEWVELYNDNDFKINLVNWLIDDLAEGGSNPWKFSLIIEANSYGVVSLGKTMLNNAGDEVRLTDSLGEPKDFLVYPKTESSQGWGKQSNSWCFQEATPGQQNLPCSASRITPTISSPVLSKITQPPALKTPKEENNVLGEEASVYVYLNKAPIFKTYLKEEKELPSLLLASKRLDRVSDYWLPDWLLLSWGGGSFGFGLTRIFRRKFLI